MLFYVNGFKDGHLFLETNLQRIKRWPGIIIKYRRGKYFVHYSVKENNSNTPPVGSELVKCDNKEPEFIMKQEIFPFHGDESLESNWYKFAPQILIDMNNPWRQKLSRCTFLIGNKVLQDYELSWRNIPNHSEEVNPLSLIKDAIFGPSPKFEIRNFEKNASWISLPTFSPNKDDSHKLEKMISSLKNLRTKKLLVFDLRGNTGGNSQWGENILKELYGEYKHEDIPQERVEWRVSSENKEYIGKVLPYLEKNFGKESEIFRSFHSTHENMILGLKKNEVFCEEPRPAASFSGSSNKNRNTVKGKIVLLTDGHCASACLYFADELLALPQVTHVGLPTSADTLYMDIRGVDLPGKVFSLYFAQKVYRDRPRGSGIPYIPQFIWDGEMSDTNKIERWIFGLLKLQRK